MSKIPNKTTLLHSAFIDDISIRGVKYTHHAHLGELFEVQYAPFDYTYKVKNLKLIKNFIAHKVDKTNLNVVGFLVRQHQKMLARISNYGPWYKKRLEQLKRKVRQLSEARLIFENQSSLRYLPYQSGLEYLTIEIGEDNGAEEEEEGNDNSMEEENEDGSPNIKKGKQPANKPKTRSLRLPKLKKIRIEGQSNDQFIELLRILNRDLPYLKSLKEIELVSLEVASQTEFIKLIPELKIFSLIKNIQISYCDFSNPLIYFFEHAEHLPNLESLSGLISSEVSFNASQLAKFNSLKTIDLTFFRGDPEPTKKALFEIISSLAFPQSLQTLKINFVHLETEYFTELCEIRNNSESAILGSLPNLNTVSLTLTVNPTVSSKMIGSFFNVTNGVKNLYLDITNSIYIENWDTIEGFNLVDLLGIAGNSVSTMNSLVLRLPKISLEGLPENSTPFTNLEELSLEGSFGLHTKGKVKELLKLMNPQKLKKLTLHEVEYKEGEGDIYEHIELIKEFTEIEKLSLIYKNVVTSEKLLYALKNVLKSFGKIRYFFLKIDKEDENFENFNKKMIQSLVTVETMEFVKIEPYIYTKGSV